MGHCYSSYQRYGQIPREPGRIVVISEGKEILTTNLSDEQRERRGYCVEAIMIEGVKYSTNPYYRMKNIVKIYR